MPKTNAREMPTKLKRPKGWLTVNEFCAKHGMTSQNAHNHISRGNIEAVRVYDAPTTYMHPDAPPVVRRRRKGDTP